MRMLANYSEETSNFLKHIRKTLRDSKVELKFSRAKRVRCTDGDLVEGFFSEPTATRRGEIRIATKSKRPSTILAVLAHEYVHFLQWKQGDRIYLSSADYVQLEKHTEKMAMRLLREWKVPLNYRAVKRRSDAYLAYLIRNSITG